VNFYNAVLRIWLGDKPVDRSLKPALLGSAGKSQTKRANKKRGAGKPGPRFF
jgi:hypothetical protein